MKNNDIEAVIQEGQNALLDFANGPANDAADIIATSFKRAGKEISSSLADAARNGEFSVKSLASAILRDLQNIALKQYVEQPISNALGQIFAAIPNYGARASGGPVNAGGAYLVGENGPEIFLPQSSGNIQNAISSPINININMPQGANLNDVKRSANQVATALARAVERGRGRL